MIGIWEREQGLQKEGTSLFLQVSQPAESKMAQTSFYVGDYVVFGVTVFISLSIGVYYALSGGRQKTTAGEYTLLL